MSKRRVLVLSEGFGSGHTQAAHALSEGIKTLDPSISTRVFELGSFLNPKVAPVIISAYRKTVSKQPKVVGLMYRSNYKKPTTRLTKLALHKLFYTQTVKLIKHIRPVAIVCTHPVPNMITSRLIANGLQVPLYTVITDYDAHGSWINDEVSQYFVAADKVKQKLLDRGIDNSKVTVTGIPVRPNFWEKKLSKSEIRKNFNLKDMPTVLIMGGGWGLLNEDSALSYMTKWRESTQIIICTASNIKMRDDLLNNPLFRHPNIHIIGFTKQVDQLMEISDLLVTKPGGMTCTEGFSKALPMLFYEPIPGQEEENCEFFISMGYGEMLQDHDTVDRWFKLIHSKDKLTVYKQKLQEIRDKQYDASKCAKTILQML